MKRVLTLLALVAVLSICFTSCKEKKEKVVPKKTIVKKDTIKPKKVVKAEPVKPKKPNKYFLMAGTFEYKHRADAFYDKLVEQGYDARVFVTEDGFFYRISYMGFSDRDEAFEMLAEERSKEETKDVWLHILPDSYE